MNLEGELSENVYNTFQNILKKDPDINHFEEAISKYLRTYHIRKNFKIKQKDKPLLRFS